MNKTEIIAENIKKYLEKKDLNKRDFAKKCGLKETTLYSILNGETKNPTITSLEPIAKEMDITLDELTNNNDNNKLKIYMNQLEKKMKKLNEKQQLQIITMIDGAINATIMYN